MKGIVFMITINNDRTVYIPEKDRHIGFENDHLVETRYFDITDENILSFSFKLDLESTKNIVDLEKVTLDNGKCVLVWKITSSAIGEGGIITAQLRAFDETGEKVWHSHMMEFVSDKSVNGEKQIDDEKILSEFEQLESRVTNAVRTAEEMSASAASHAGNAEIASRNADEYSVQASESALTAQTACDNAQASANSASTTLEAVLSAATRFEDAYGSAGEIASKTEAHYAAKNNPHGVTASQVNAYTKEETHRLLEEKVQESDVFEFLPFYLKDFDCSFDNTGGNPSDFVGDNYISSPFLHTITIHCKGETLGFTASANSSATDRNYAKLKVNGEYVIDNTSGLLTYTTQPILMTDDIVAELSSDGISFSNMVQKAVKGYRELKDTLGDVNTALDEILALQDALMGGGAV